MRRAPSLKIAIVGAESTGKTELARTLIDHLQTSGASTSLVSEFLREWCEREQRTPQAHEQRAIAQEQARRVEAAPAGTVVVADTTPLMTAVYSDMLFDDASLYEFALLHQRGYDLTLLTALDLPWIADGLQRDGPHVRPEVDHRVRRALDRSGIAYHLVHGQGQARLAQALAIVHHAQRQRGANPDGSQGAWVWHCAHCGDARCEHRLFRDLAGADSVRR